MIYFEEWWNLGENCIVSIYNGVIADDKKQNDTCISTKDQLEPFIDCIANNIYVYNQTEKKYTYQKNITDQFLNHKMVIDFDTNILFIFVGAEIKEILFSKIFQCYLIKFSEKRCESCEYSAGLVKKYKTDDNTFKYQLMNEKPPNIFVNRPKNDNDDY